VTEVTWTPVQALRPGRASPFFDALERGALLLSTNQLGEFFDPRDVVDPQGRGLVPADTTGGGRVESWSLLDEDRHADGPRSYAAIIQLDEGPWWWGRLVVPHGVEVSLHFRVRMAVAHAGASDVPSAPVPYWVPE
jgi:uncharacterized OB-fold protein